MAPDEPDRSETPDIEIGASARAKRLRFRDKPRTEVELHGEIAEPERGADIDMTSAGERENLPDEVEPGVTYRDVSVRWRAAGRIEPDERPDTQQRRRRR
jgi:hypothetical protein